MKKLVAVSMIVLMMLMMLGAAAPKKKPDNQGNKKPKPTVTATPETTPKVTPQATPQPQEPTEMNGFIKARGKDLVDGSGTIFSIKGMAFGNGVFSNPSVAPRAHHTEESYAELAELGFNSIRFYLNYALFESDSAPYNYNGKDGWEWLDWNIRMARRYNIRLILNMTYPQGGYQSLGNGMDLWTKVDNQYRLIALWKEIARRYQDEIAIGGYELLNEPYVPEKSTLEATFAQWKNLAQEITDAIRTVDQNHLIVVEKLNKSKNIETGAYNWTDDMNGDMNFFLIDDPNVAYTFHDYSPFRFTHQGADWAGTEGVYATYPDESTVVGVNGPLTWKGATFSNPQLDRTNGDWQELKGEKFKVTDPNFKIGMAALQAYKIGSEGTVWVDDITVNEYDENGDFVRQIVAYDFTESFNWWYYCMDGSGNAEHTAAYGHDAKGSYMISGTTEDANISEGDGMFLVKQGYYYEIRGWVKGANIAPDAIAKLRVDFFHADEANYMNKEYLEKTITKYLTFGQEHNVPMYLGEFGVINHGFEENRGGERWVADVLDICRKYNINFNFHTYHEDGFGLYRGNEYSYPVDRNEALYEVFKEALSKPEKEPEPTLQPTPEPSQEPTDMDGFIKARGTDFVDGSDAVFTMKGMAFGNDVWNNPSIAPREHHTEESYAELAELGFNSIRFYLNYAIFESDSKPYDYEGKDGWEWLDWNIRMARKYNMRLILNMHYPQGGYQSLGEGMALWTEEENQKRLIALWKEIARRYKDEIAIGGFDLLNEPYVPEQSTVEETFSQWQNLAQEIAYEIRTVDQNHLIIVEKLQNAKNMETGAQSWNENMNGDMNFFLIDDPNVAYTFHEYMPFYFTHQGAEWLGLGGKYTTYPDETTVTTKGSVSWKGATFSNPQLNPQNGEWQELKSQKFQVNDPNFRIGMTTLQAYMLGSQGKVWVDDVVVNEYDEKGAFVRQISLYDFNKNTNWWYYCMDGSGNAEYTAIQGHNANGSYMVSGTTEDANICDTEGMFPVKQGYYYEVRGWVKGANLASDAIVKLRVDFSDAEEVYLMNKEYLEKTITKYLTFGQENNVPLYFGEFGVICYGFEEDRGGDRWVTDVLDICKQYNINFNYQTYHANAFGLYRGDVSYPVDRNEVLYEVFRKALSDW